MAEPVVRLTVNLTEEAAQKLQELATQLGTNRTTALHKAIFTTAFLRQEEKDGGVVQVKNPTKNTIQEVRVKS